MTGSASLRGWRLLGLIFCGIGLERLLNAQLVGPLGSDFSMRFSIGLICTVTGLAVIIAWLWGEVTVQARRYAVFSHGIAIRMRTAARLCKFQRSAELNGPRAARPRST